MYVSRKVVLLVSAVVCSSLALPSFAASSGKANSDRWLLAKYDANGDQVITINEVNDKRVKLFAYMDGNMDGQVSFDEYQHLDIRKRQMLLQARFEKLDLDDDGNLSDAEYSSYLGSFERFDHNGDGEISAEEMAQRPQQKAASDDDAYCLLWLCVRSSIH